MPYGITDTGGTEMLRTYFNNEQFQMALYDDSTDQLGDAASTADISTEPTGSGYDRQTISFSDISVTASDGTAVAVVDIASQAFNVSDSTQNVDSYALIDLDNNLQHRGPIDTSDRQTDYINLDQNDEVLIGGQPVEFV